MTHTLTICNVSTSAMVRECEWPHHPRRGRDRRGSHQGLHHQLVGLFLLTLALAQTRGPAEARASRKNNTSRPAPPARRLQAVLALEPQVIAWAEEFARKENACSSAAACTTPSRWKGAEAQGDQLHPRRGLPGR